MLVQFKGAQRKDFLRDDKRYLKHNSLGCLMDSNGVVAFATVERVEEGLLLDPPQVTLHIPDSRALDVVLAKLKDKKCTVDFAVVDTAMFAYEPVLDCLKRLVELPLAKELIGLADEEGRRDRVVRSSIFPGSAADSIEKSQGMDLQLGLNVPKKVDLDPSQVESLLSGLRQTVSLIQGPPGKPFLY